MSIDLSPAEIGKFIAAKHAVQEVQSGMTLGLGTGSTARWFVKLLAHEIRENGLQIEACMTSQETRALASALDIYPHLVEVIAPLDLAVDGADEFDGQNNLIKGGGGALYQEKVVEFQAKRLVIITDKSKEVETLGAFPLPIEISEFGWTATQKNVEAVLADMGLPTETTWREAKGSLFFSTDEGNRILDLHLGAIPNAHALNTALIHIPGVNETGLFLDMADAIIMGDDAGTARFREGTGDWQEKTYDLSSEADLIATLQAMDNE
ncbi:MAG: ribose-5-phosphate isomerase RpiA [Pseudomonadota bacterium]